MMAETEYVIDGNTAVEFKLVRKEEDLYDERQVFRPEMCHQIFGAEEFVYGYKDLKIKLYYTAGLLQVYCAVEYSEKIDEVEVSDIMRKIKPKYEFDLIENIQDFHKVLTSEKANPFGTLLTEFKYEDDVRGEQREFEIYYCSNTTPGFIKFHQRLQTFVIWFIDAASYIDIDDSGWNFFILYEKYHSASEIKYAVAGYATVYDYYAYPEHIRPRISQVLILPPFQSKGLCVKLLFAIYDYYITEKNNIMDFTVEDPSEEFQKVRDYVDCLRVMEKKVITQSRIHTEPRENLLDDMHSVCKINKRQARRVYEILKLKSIDRMNMDEFMDYRVELKRRLNHQYFKQTKLSSLLHPLTPQVVDDRKVTLQDMFEKLLDQYVAVNSRIQKSETCF